MEAGPRDTMGVEEGPHRGPLFRRMPTRVAADWLARLQRSQNLGTLLDFQPLDDWCIGAFHDEETLLDYDFAMSYRAEQSWQRLAMVVQGLRLRRQDAEVALWSPPLARGSA